MDIYKQLEVGKETIAFRVSNACPAHSEFGHISLNVVYVKSDKGRYDDSIGFYENYFTEKHQYKGLSINCQMSRDKELPYGWEITVNARSSDGLTLTQAEDIVKTLRPINRKLRKISEKEGDVESFEEFVVRVGRVLGVKAFYGRYENNTQCQRNDNIGALRSYLRSLIKENQNKLGYSSAA